MARILINSKALSETLPSMGTHEDEYMEVKIIGSMLHIWGIEMPIVGGMKGLRDETVSIENSSIKRLISLCKIILEQPIVLIFEENSSIIGVDGIIL